MTVLLPALHTASHREAVRFGARTLTYAELAGAAGATASRIGGAQRVAVWATPTPETVVAVTAALLAGVAAVPLNPRTGARELAHIVADSAPSAVLARAGDKLPAGLTGIARVDIPPTGPAFTPPAEPPPESPALIVYTSGTTGPPKGAVLPRRAIAATLDALAEAWQWTADDVLVHALPLFHVHGLILGILGPLRRGGSVRHLGRFSTDGVTGELLSGATMLFGVPTMYHRIAGALETDRELAGALVRARILVSGSAALPVHDHERIRAATGRQVVERYGMTETLMLCSVLAAAAHPDSAARPGTVGVPLRGVELRLVDEADGIGEIQVRGPNLFLGYLNRPDATAAAFDGDWFRTGDLAGIDDDGQIRIVGRKATDLIKSGGFKIGAGEIENALLEHPGVSEAAVTGEADPDLGERIVAWIVPADPSAPPGEAELADHVAERLSPHKRPRTVRYLGALPRNEMGKIMKRSLSADAGA